VNVGIIAAGAWGTALAICLSKRHRVILWSHDKAQVEAMLQERENHRYLPGYALPPMLEVSHDLAATLNMVGVDKDNALLIIATPIAGLRPCLQNISQCKCDAPLIWACKGFESENGVLPHQVAAECLKHDKYGVLSGPSFAAEVAAGKPTALSLAMTAASQQLAQRLSAELHTQNLRIYPNEDMIGVEAGGALKNIMAIATGVCDGLQLGDNARAALITRGLAEMARFGEAIGARRSTFMGLSGVGDLLLTCTGNLSRNRKVGLALAAGKTLDDTLRNLGHIAEGVSTAHEVARLATEMQVEMPVTQAVATLLAGEVNATEAVERLLARHPKSSNET